MPSLNLVCDIENNYFEYNSACVLLATSEFEGETWYLVRRNAQTIKWHHASDNATGSDSYGTVSNNPTGPDIFSIKYDTCKWNKILFAWGNF